MRVTEAAGEVMRRRERAGGLDKTGSDRYGRGEEGYRVIESGDGAVFFGRQFTREEIGSIGEVVGMFPLLSRAELAGTVCEHMSWVRPNGELKWRECLEVLERLERAGLIRLPEKKGGRPKGSRTRVPITQRGERREEVTGSVRDVAPLSVEVVKTAEERSLWRELVGRYHALGHAVPFGAHVRYLVWVARPERQVVACLQYSSPAWRMAVRDRWIGWEDGIRAQRLQRIVNNSRFLMLPWVKVKNLASAILAEGVRRVKRDWPEWYGVEPVLLETLVDPAQFTGTCYRAANWIEVGQTSGRGRMDRENLRHGEAPKTVFLYPLVADAARRLREV